MLGKEALVLSMIIAALSSATLVHASDPLPNKGKQVASSSWLEPLKEQLNWAGCLSACLVPGISKVCVYIGRYYATFGTIQYACFKDLCEYLIPGAEMIYEGGSCDSKIGRIKAAEHHKKKRARPSPSPLIREEPVFKDHFSGKQ